MKRYRRIETERASLSDSEIAQLKPSFSNLTEGMKVMPAITTGPPVRYLVTAIVGAAIVAVLVVSYYLFIAGGSDINDDVAPQLAEDITERRISPPDPARIDYEYFRVVSGERAVLTTKKGTRIMVPPGAFAWADGTTFAGSADLRFAEFHDVVEIFLSGVPMTYDSAGVNYTFQSAGMFDIMAFSGGNSLILADGKEITIDLVSNDPDIYNLYYYDTVVNHWQYLSTEQPGDIVHYTGRDDTRRPESGQRRISTEAAGELLAEGGLSQKKQVPLPDVSPEKPFKRRDSRNFAFKIDFDEKSFPELSGISDLMFEITDNSVEKKYLRGTWDSIALERDTEQGYRISLFRLRSSYSFNAQPVLNASEYDAVVESYRNAAAKREQEIAERRSSTVAQRAVAERMDANMRNWAYSRSVSVVNMGTWNLDIPVPRPENATVIAAGFMDGEGKAINPQSVFIAQQGVNILWNYSPAQLWFYSQSRQNIMWFIMPDGNYAIITDNRIRSREKTLVPDIVDADKALAEIRKYI